MKIVIKLRKLYLIYKMLKMFIFKKRMNLIINYKNFKINKIQHLLMDLILNLYFKIRLHQEGL
jgi:hypothetical protein